MGNDVMGDLSRHASMRARQRGIPNASIRFLLLHADREVPAGSRCTALTVSRRLSDLLISQGESAELVNRARRIALVVGSAGRIVTVMHQAGTRSRRYRHPFASRVRTVGIKETFHG